MQPSEDPGSLTASERFHEIAGILALGILRLRSQSAIPADDSAQKNPAESGPTCLEVPAKTVLSVLSG
jgi:hypothetical protein